LGGLPPRLRWFIALVATAGFLAVVAVVLLDPGRWDRTVWPRLAALLVLTAASELGGLRLPHRGALEMLTLYEGMVVANIALLPAGQAIAVSLAGLLAAQVVQRRAPFKAVFNLGMYATALAPAAYSPGNTSVRLPAGPHPGRSPCAEAPRTSASAEPGTAPPSVSSASFHRSSRISAGKTWWCR
jgi:hypothetical protein